MTESFIKYRAYTISQFVLDDAFIDWVKAPNEERIAFWEEFQEVLLMLKFYSYLLK